VINNLRDIPTDRVVGKRTLAVRLGDQRTRYLYVALMVLGVLSGTCGAFWNPWLLLVLATGIFVMLPISKVRGGATGKDLIEVLGDTGRSQLILGVLVTVAFIIGG
jgi:1,4-dihydroxy-2-naphthoate octaprenyltransferase